MNEARATDETGAAVAPEAVALAILWGLGPMLPAWIAGAIPGSPFTDLYPSVWSVGWFAGHAVEVLPRFAPELAAPAGMPFYAASPLHGALGVLLVPLVGVAQAYTIGVAAARVATVLCAAWAATGLGLGRAGALGFAAVYGCAPFFQGYAVEGIVEGTDGWTLALWVGFAARQRWGPATLAAALTVLSSWYLGMAGCLAAAAVAPWSWRATASFGAGVAIASPALAAFLSSFSGGTPLEPAIRRAMGASLTLFPTPGLAAGTNPFAKTTWIGFLPAGLALWRARKEPWWLLGAVVAFLLALGAGPIYALPVWKAVRFPYRLHAAVLLAVGRLAGGALDRLPLRVGIALAFAIVVEAMLLSPIEPVLPSAPAAVSAIRCANPGAVVLDVPGPVAMPPGKVNPSRPRARYLLYELGVCGTRTPWAFDFNGVGARGGEAPAITAVRTWDRVAKSPRAAIDVPGLRAAGVDLVAVHPDDLGADAAVDLARALTSGGARAIGDDGAAWFDLRPVGVPAQ